MPGLVSALGALRRLQIQNADQIQDMVSSDEDSALVKKEGQVDPKEDLEVVALRD